MTDKEDHVIISDGHYCPLGAEQTKDERKLETPGAAHGLKTSPSEPVLSSHTSTSHSDSPATQTSADPSSDSAPSQDLDKEETTLANGVLPCSDSDPSAQSEAVSVVKSSLYPDEQAVKDYLKKLTDNTQTEAKTGGLHSLLVSSPVLLHNNDCIHVDVVVLSNILFLFQPSATINNLVASCASAVGERVASTYEALSLKKMMNYLPSGVSRSGGPTGLTGTVPGVGDNTTERVRQEDSMQGKKSSSTGDIREEEAESVRRRLSLPGLLSQGRYAVHLLSSSYALLRKYALCVCRSMSVSLFMLVSTAKSFHCVACFVHSRVVVCYFQSNVTYSWFEKAKGNRSLEGAVWASQECRSFSEPPSLLIWQQDYSDDEEWRTRSSDLFNRAEKG